MGEGHSGCECKGYHPFENEDALFSVKLLHDAYYNEGKGEESASVLDEVQQWSENIFLLAAEKQIF